MSNALFWLRSILADGQVLQRSGRGFIGVAPDALAFSDHVEPASNNAYDLGITGTRWRTAYLGTALDAPKWTYAGAAEIDLTGATTRTLTVRNSTIAQVANVDVDGAYVWRGGHATGTFTLAGTPTGARTITFPDASITVASLAGTETLTNKTLTTPRVDGLKTTAGDTVITISAVPSAVRGVTITPGDTGNDLEIAASGENGAGLSFRADPLGTPGSIRFRNPGNTSTLFGYEPLAGGAPTFVLQTGVDLGAAPTINTVNGQAAIQPGAASLVVTNLHAKTTSVIHCTLQAVDGTLTQILTVVPTAGSFTVTGNANATGATQFGFTIFNPAA